MLLPPLKSIHKNEKIKNKRDKAEYNRFNICGDRFMILAVKRFVKNGCVPCRAGTASEGGAVSHMICRWIHGFVSEIATLLSVSTIMI